MFPDDGLVLHARHVLAVMMSLFPVVVMMMSAWGEDVLERGHLVALHGGLQRADRVDLGHDDAGPLAGE